MMGNRKFRGATRYKWDLSPRQKETQVFRVNELGELIPLDKDSHPEVREWLESVDSKTEINRQQPNAYLNFQKLVKENNTEKLIEYFSQYGIDPTIVQLSLKTLIEEELRDLSR